jgi:hypothetical protein
MVQPSQNSLTATRFDSLVVGICQILQPTTPNEVMEFAKGSKLAKAIPPEMIISQFPFLERNKFLFRTSDDRFVVTPKGENLADRAISARDRTKIRLLRVNSLRFQNLGGMDARV